MCELFECVCVLLFVLFGMIGTGYTRRVLLCMSGMFNSSNSKSYRNFNGGGPDIILQYKGIVALFVSSIYNYWYIMHTIFIYINLPQQ